MEYFFTPLSELPSGVGFELFGLKHGCWLIISGCITLLLCLFCRRADKPGRRRIRRGTGCAVLAFELIKNINLIATGQFSVYFLPLHLCSLAVFFTFFNCLRPGETIDNFLYSTCMPGALSALLFPDWTAYPAFCLHSCVAFFAHTLLFAYPLMLTAAGEIAPRVRLLPRCLLILLCLAAVIYPIDRALGANYMFLLSPAAGSPLEWFASVLGVPGYLLGFFPLIAVIWSIEYLPFRKKHRAPMGAE